MEPAVSFSPWFHSYFKLSNSSVPHNGPPVTDEETEIQKAWLRLKQNEMPRKAA